MTIYEIKARTLETAPYFFTRDTMKFFGQTMKSFTVKKQTDGRYFISAPRMFDGKINGYTTRFFNPANNLLELN